MDTALPSFTHEIDSALYGPMPTQEAADFLGVAVLTMEEWRRNSRKKKRLFGLSWINLAVDDGKEIIRHRLVDLISWL